MLLLRAIFRTIVYAVLKFDEIVCYKDSTCSNKIADMDITPATDIRYTLEDPHLEVKQFRFCVSNEVDEMNLATRSDAEREEWRLKINSQVAVVRASRNSQIQILSTGSTGSNRRRRTRTRVAQDAGLLGSPLPTQVAETIEEEEEEEEAEEQGGQYIYQDAPVAAGSGKAATSAKRTTPSVKPTDGSNPILSDFMEKEGHFIRNW